MGRVFDKRNDEARHPGGALAMHLPNATEARSMIEGELGPQERLLWAGQPRAGLIVRPSDAFLIPFSLLWGGFAVFWEYSVVTDGAPFFFMVWGIPFVLVGLYFIFGRFLVDRKQREKTTYGLTNERVVIVSGLFGRTVKSLNLRTLSDVSLSERPNGSGTITFGQGHPYSWWVQGMGWWPGMPPAVPAFELIPDAKGVYETLRRAQRSAT
jgi:hypothetical protein